MNKQVAKDGAFLLLRLAIGGIFLLHGIPKLLDPTGTSSFFSSLSLLGISIPGFLGPVTGVVEVAGAILIILGIWHMWANYALAIVMAGSLILVHIAKGIDAGFERNVLILICCLVLALAGPGKYSLRSNGN